MPFVVATSRKPGAVLGMTVGQFLGPGRQYAVLNRLNSLALYRLSNEDSLSAEQDDSRDGVTATHTPSYPASEPTLQFVKEFPLFATVKYVECVSIYDQQSGTFLRDILFLLTVKQELSLVAFAASGSGSVASAPSPDDASAITAITLYHGEVDGCLYQYYPGETHLVAATPQLLAAPTSPIAPPKALSADLLNPFVVFAVSRGELFVLDVLIAIGLYAKQKHTSSSSQQQRKMLLFDAVNATLEKSKATAQTVKASLFPASFWQLAKERARGECISKCALHSSEYEVRDIVFLPPQATPPCLSRSEQAHSQRGGGGGVGPTSFPMPFSSITSSPLPSSPSSPVNHHRGGIADEVSLTMLLLFADIHGRTHVSSYALSCSIPRGAQEALPKVGEPMNNGSGNPRPAPFRYLEGLLDGYDRRFGRTGVLVSNCDPTAAKILPLRDATLLIGSLLVTAIPANNSAGGSGTGAHAGGSFGGGGSSIAVVNSGAGGAAGASSTRTHSPVTTELPQGLEFACVCPCRQSSVEGVHDANRSWGAFVFFKDGTVVAVSTSMATSDGNHSMVSRLRSRVDVVPTNVLHLGQTRFLVCSRFDNTVVADLSERSDCSSVATVVSNTGPVLDLTVMRDQASCPTVVAATGVGRNGGVSLIRAAAVVTEYSCATLWPLQATKVLQAGRLVAITSEYGSRFFCLEERVEPLASSVEERAISTAPLLQPPPPPQRSLTGSGHSRGAADSGRKRLRAPSHEPRTLLTTLALSGDVQFDASLSDAHIVAISQVGAEDNAFRILDSRGRIHCATLTATTLGGWKLQRVGGASAGGSHSPPVGATVGFPVAFSVLIPFETFRQPQRKAPASTPVNGGAVAVLSDGSHFIRCYWSAAELGAASPFLDVSLDNPISCLAAFVMPFNEESAMIVILAGDWTGHLSIFSARAPTLNTWQCTADGASQDPSATRCTSHKVRLAAPPKSIGVLPRVATAGPPKGAGSDMAGCRVFVGLLNGCFQQVSLPALLGDHQCVGRNPSASAEVTPPVFLMRHPVDFSVVEGKDMLLCRGPSPLLMLVRPPPSVEGTMSADICAWKATVELTGVTVPGLVDFVCFRYCRSFASSSSGGETVLEAMSFLRNYHGCHLLSVGSLPEVAQKSSHTFLKMGCTVTHIRHIPPWDKFALSLRHADTDVITFLPSNALDPAWKTPLLPSHSFNLLENERCVFVEPLFLGGKNERPVGATGQDDCGGQNRTDSALALRGQRATRGDFVVLVGSTFAFPDELRPRSSRITWYRRSNDNRPTERASKDIGGQLQCCCPVPNYSGRIALGVSGCVLIFAWNAVERMFVAEERLRIGMMVTKLIPLYDHQGNSTRREREVDELPTYLDQQEACQPSGSDPQDKRAPPQQEPLRSACLVALDARYSAMFVSVDIVQGGLEIAARDKQLRGIMDGEVIDVASRKLFRDQSAVAPSSADGEQELCMFDDNMNFLCVQRPAHPSRNPPADSALGAAAAAPRQPADGVVTTPTLQDSPTQRGVTGSQVPPPPTTAGSPTGVDRDGGTTATPAPPPGGTGLTRLRPHAFAHLGDLVTAVQRGSLALPTVREDIVPTPDTLIPGLDAEQLIWGTTHGGFGVVSSVSRATYLFLKAIEQALLFASEETPVGGFTHDGFREISTIGQERSHNLMGRLPRLGHEENRQGALSTEQSGAVDVCSADVAEAYLDLDSDDTKRAVLRLAEGLVVGAFAATASTSQSGATLVLPNLNAMTPNELTSHLANGEVRDQCNSIFEGERLPTLPFRHDSVEAFLLNLQRTH